MINSLINLCKEKGACGVPGLGAALDDIPNFVLNRNFDRFGQEPQGAAAAMLEFNKGVIDSIKDVLPAVVFNRAKYEVYGAAGVVVLEEAVKYAKAKGLYTIVDTGLAVSQITVDDVINQYLGQTDIFGVCSRVCETDAIIVDGFDKGAVKAFENACSVYGRSVFLRTNDTEGIKSMYTAPLDGYSNIGIITGAKNAIEISDEIKNTFIIVSDYDNCDEKDIKALNEKRDGQIYLSQKGIECAFHEGDWNELDYYFASTEAAMIMKEKLEK